MKRRWGQWLNLTLREINATSGVFALAGAGVATTGLVLAAPFVLGLGGTLFVATTGWCAYKGLPPRLTDAKDLLGQPLRDLSALDSIHPTLPRVAFVGASRAGKSTLLAHLQAETPPIGRTDAPYAMVVRLPGAGESYFAMIDGAGGQYAQQFRIVDAAEEIVLFLDHTEDDQATEIDQRRLKTHEEFIRQLAGHLKTSGKPLKSIHFLLNKRDLWEEGSDAHALSTWFNAQVSGWKLHAIATTVTSERFSNRITGDLAPLVDLLRQWAARKR